MERVAIDDVEPSGFGTDADRRGLSEPLGTTDVAVNRYRVGPGERFSGGLHAHADQEEVFLVVEGEATFETLDGEVAVAAGGAVRFGRGEFQSGKNDSDGDVVAYALGAPRDTEDVRVPLECRECGHGDVRPTVDDDGETTLVCPDCGAESVVACPECGGNDKRVVLAEDGTPVDRCLDCGAETAV